MKLRQTMLLVGAALLGSAACVAVLPADAEDPAGAACVLVTEEAAEVRAVMQRFTPEGEAEAAYKANALTAAAEAEAACAAEPTTTTTTEATTTTTEATTTTTTEPEEPTCSQTVTGEHTITQPGVYDGLCVVDGTLVIAASDVRITNANLTAAPPENFAGVYVLPNRTNVEIDHSLIDCGPADTGTPIAAHGVQAEAGTTLNVHHNEIKDCTDGIILASNSYYGFNYIHSPDNTDESHADGVQFSTEDDGTPIHDTTFEHNTIEFPLASASFQFHQSGIASEGPRDLTVRYNSFTGGAAVVRLPLFDNGGNEFYGNRLARFDAAQEFFVCTNSTGSIDVWGSETGNSTDSDGDGVLDDDNVNGETGAVLRRADCA